MLMYIPLDSPLILSKCEEDTNPITHPAKKFTEMEMFHVLSKPVFANTLRQPPNT